MTTNDKPIIGELPAITLDKDGLVQRQVNQIRDKIVELTRVANTVAALMSVAVRLLSGERVKPGSKLPGLVVHTFVNASPTPDEVSHGLGRHPIGYLIIRKYPIGKVADGAIEDWNPLTAFLQTDTPGLTITVLFF